MTSAANKTSSWIDHQWLKTLTLWTNIFYQIPDALIKSIPIILFSASIWPMLLVLCCNIINNILTALTYLNTADKNIWFYNTSTNSAWDILHQIVIAAMLVSCTALYFYKAESFTGWAANLGLMSAYAFWIHWAAVLYASLAVINTITNLYQASSYAGWSLRRSIISPRQHIQNVMHVPSEAKSETKDNSVFTLKIGDHTSGHAKSFKYFYYAETSQTPKEAKLLNRIKKKIVAIKKTKKYQLILEKIKNHISNERSGRANQSKAIHEDFPQSKESYSWYPYDPDYIHHTYRYDNGRIPIMEAWKDGKSSMWASMLKHMQNVVDSDPWKLFFNLANGAIDAVITFITFSMRWNLPVFLIAMLSAFNFIEALAFAFKYNSGETYKHPIETVKASVWTYCLSVVMHGIIQISALTKTFCKLLLGSAVTLMLGLSPWLCWSVAVVYAVATWLRNASNGLYSANAASNKVLSVCFSGTTAPSSHNTKSQHQAPDTPHNTKPTTTP